MSAVSNPWAVLALLGGAFFMVILDATIVLTAIPSIQSEIGVEVAGAQWIVTAYSVPFGGLLLLGGRAADLFGRRRVFLGGLAGFVAASLACAVATSLPILVSARVVQGGSAAIMVPSALSMVLAAFDGRRDRNKAVGIWGGIGGIGATVGLVLGGLLVSGPGWRWVFLINVPIGVGLAVGARLFVPEWPRLQRKGGIDLAGAVAITAGLLLLVLGLTLAPDLGWDSGPMVTLGVLIAIAAVGFVAIESRSPAPIVPLRILRRRELIGGNLVVLVAGMCVNGLLFPLTLFSQGVLDLSPLEFGLLSTVMTITSVIGALVVQRLVTRYGAFRPAGAGLGLIGLAAALVGSDSKPSIPLLVVALCVFGVGMSGAFVAGQIAAVSGVARDETGLAAGLVDTSFGMGGAVGVAIATSVAMSATTGSRAIPVGELVQAGSAGDAYRAAISVVSMFALAGLIAAITFLRPKGTGDMGSPSTARRPGRRSPQPSGTTPRPRAPSVTPRQWFRPSRFVGVVPSGPLEHDFRRRSNRTIVAPDGRQERSGDTPGRHSHPDNRAQDCP